MALAFHAGDGSGSRSRPRGGGASRVPLQRRHTTSSRPVMGLGASGLGKRSWGCCLRLVMEDLGQRKRGGLEVRDNERESKEEEKGGKMIKRGMGKGC